jgi:hypothetical protein
MEDRAGNIAGAKVLYSSKETQLWNGRPLLRHCFRDRFKNELN